MHIGLTPDSYVLHISRCCSDLGDILSFVLNDMNVICEAILTALATQKKYGFPKNPDFSPLFGNGPKV